MNFINYFKGQFAFQSAFCLSNHKTM